MQKCMSDYLDAVCGTIKRKPLRALARAELSDHLLSHRDELTAAGLDEEAASQEAVAAMGDPFSLGQKINAANRTPLRSLAFLGGACLALLGTYLVFLWSATSPLLFFDPPSIVGVTLLSLAFGFLSRNDAPFLPSLLRNIKTGALYAGVIIALVGVVTLMANLSDPALIGQGAALALLSVFYGLLLSAGARVAESHLQAPDAELIRALLA